jgi:hypothetical protein
MSSSHVINQVAHLCTNKLGCDVKPEDISSAYVLPPKRCPGAAATALPTPDAKVVVVKFVRRVVRDSVYCMQQESNLLLTIVL